MGKSSCTSIHLQYSNVASLSFSACLNLTYDPYEFSITSNMLMNDNSVFMNTFTGKTSDCVLLANI